MRKLMKYFASPQKDTHITPGNIYVDLNTGEFFAGPCFMIAAVDHSEMKIKDHCLGVFNNIGFLNSDIVANLQTTKLPPRSIAIFHKDTIDQFADILGQSAVDDIVTALDKGVYFSGRYTQFKKISPGQTHTSNFMGLAKNGAPTYTADWAV